ncbi:hypothetical protein EII22_07035 [Coriobacteriales bacterium OH1046]|nr:hypothetical protein EII22_07035 [Coriobacteriales bacterium OH1046]
MDIRSIVGNIIGLAQDNPSILGSLIEHPYSTVRTISGAEDVSREEASQVVTAVSSLAQGKAVDFDALGGMASLLLGQNDNSVHTLAGSLFGSLLGGGADKQEASAEAPAAGFNLDLGQLATIAGSLLTIANATGIATKKTKKGGVDLSDGIGLDDIAGVASTLMDGTATTAGRKSSKKAASKPAVDLSDGVGLDDVIGIAGTLLGGK